MVGKRGEASITFKVSSNIVKKPSGIKKIFGKIQRVIEQDVPIPEDVIIRMGKESDFVISYNMDILDYNNYY